MPNARLNRYLALEVQVRNSNDRSRMNILSFRRRAPRHDHEHPGVRVRATWRGTVLADSDRTIIVEGNHYFPPEDVSTEYLSESSERTTCPWKGEASYYDVVVDGDRNEAAAWYYPEPSEAAAEIRDYVAFWKGVETDAV
jgi:uncharacterized protein (DUF427 family)